MTTTMNYDALANRKRQLIRKGLKGSCFAAPYEAAPVTNLTGSDSKLNPLPSGGWDDLGYLDSNGIAMSESITSSDIDSWGSVDPTRSDITKQTTTVKVAAQETKLFTIGMYTGVSMDTIVPAANGEVQVVQPAEPTESYFRLLAVAVDNSDAGEIYIARFLPQVKVADKDDQSYSNGNDPVLWGITFQSYIDDALGYAQKYLFGGPGWLAILDDMGFDDES